VTTTPARDEAIDLSIIIPAYNEERRLPDAIRKVTGFLDSHAFRAEVLIVENGSRDRTAAIADAAAETNPRFRALHVARPGKGRAVRVGMLEGRGRVVAFCDADFSMPVDQLCRLYDAIEAGADVAIGSREVPGARRIGEPWRRHLMGRGFNFLVRVLAVPGLEDTQCGFKAFRWEVARDLFRRQRITGWAFDVEVLFLATRGGYQVREVPITWRYDPSSRVSPLRDTIAMLRELLIVRLNAWRGRYTESGEVF
jgi:glycosyltransferase involved in cell wall biosynthesis